jgi:hypothetical protein
MRFTIAAAALTAFLAGCSTPCEELGNRLCQCRGAGTSRKTCENAISDELDRLKPDQAAQDACEAALDTCKAPEGVAFCTWLDGADGKIACGYALPPPVEPPGPP